MNNHDLFIKLNEMLANTKCPECGSGTLLERATAGGRIGDMFFKCEMDPACKGWEWVPDALQQTADQKFRKDAEFVREQHKRDRQSKELLNQPREFSENLRTVTSESTRSNFQTRYYQSAAMPEEFVDAIYRLEASEETISRFAHWRLEFPNSGRGVDERIRSVISVCETLLHRGAVAFSTPGVQKLATEKLSTGITDTNFLSNPRCSLSIPLVGEIPNEPSEQAFLDWLNAQGVSGDWAITQQLHLASIVPEALDNTETRCDFFLSHPSGRSVVIEIDGEQHKDQRKQDGHRDAQILTAGIPTIRIPVKEVDAQAGPNLEKTRDVVCNVPSSLTVEPEQVEIVRLARFAHQVQVSILEMIKGGFLDQEVCSLIQVEFPPMLDILTCTEWLDQASHDLAEMFDKCASLLGVENQIPQFHLGSLDTRDSQGQVRLLNRNVKRDSDADVFLGNTFYYSDTVFPFAINSPGPVPSTTSSRGYIGDPNIEDGEWFLNYVFRKSKFWDGQWDVVRRSLRRKESIVLTPTGGGKSISFQLSALLLPGRCLVIDPLVALIRDQKDNLRRVGIDRAVGFHRGIKQKDRSHYMKHFAGGQYLFCFIAPERLLMADFRNTLRSLTATVPISLIAIDEAHCVSEWGHDFRIPYLTLGQTAREYCRKDNVVPPLVGLTGTASQSVLKDIERILEIDLTDPDAIITPDSYERPELKFVILNGESSQKESLLDGSYTRLASDLGVTKPGLFQVNGDRTLSGMVFVPHVNGEHGVWERQEYFKKNAPAVAIHSGTKPKKHSSPDWDEEKYQHSINFKFNLVSVIVCTNSYGMGIDKPNVRHTTHMGLPQSMESFYQEAGRAGRDGQDAYCTIIFSDDNPKRAAYLLESTTDIEEIQKYALPGPNQIPWKNRDDVIRNLFFHAGNFKGAETEIDDVKELIRELKPADIEDTRDIPENTIKNADRTEKSIYRLVVLGVIKDYTRDYAGGFFKISLSGIDENEITAKLKEHIATYQLNLADQKVAEAQKYKGASIAEFAGKACEILIRFVYDTVEQTRRASLRQIYFAVKDSKGDGKKFAELIHSYFMHTEFDDRISQIASAKGIEFIPDLLRDVRRPRDANTLANALLRPIDGQPTHSILRLLKVVAMAMHPSSELEEVDADIRELIEHSEGRFPIRHEEMATAIVSSLTSPTRKINQKWKQSIVQKICSETKNRDLLRDLVMNLPVDLIDIPKTELLLRMIPSLTQLITVKD